MAWLACNDDGTELCFTDKTPERWRKEWVLAEDDIGDCYVFESGMIEKLIGRPLTWEDEPVEI